MITKLMGGRRETNYRIERSCTSQIDGQFESEVGAIIGVTKRKKKVVPK